jgi:Fic family protein
MPAFTPTYTLTPLLQRQIVAIDRCVGFLEAVELDADWRKDLRDSARLQDAVSSLQIEGSSLTIETAFRLVTKPPDRQLSEPEQEFVNYLAAFDAIDSLRGEKSYPVGRRDLLSLHGLIVAGVRGGYVNAGRLRDSEVVVGDRQGNEVVVHHRPPDPDQVQDHVEALMDWLGRVKSHPTPAQVKRGHADPWVHPVIVAGIAQHRLVWIHPFLDGNGRTARMFTTLLLYQRGYDFKYLFDLSTYYNRDRDRYYAALRTADEHGDYTLWLEYFLGGFAYQLFGIKSRAAKLATGSRAPAEASEATE